jgi:hypothetical protein
VTAPGVMEPEEVTPDCPPAMVEDVLKVLDKAIKAHQLYLPNNPTYQRSIVTAKAAIQPLWGLTESLVLQVTDTQLTYCGVPVNDHPEKGGDSLPWLLFKDGLRELAIFPGFEEEELERFLSIIPKVRHAKPHEDDLLTLLWEQDFQRLRYRYVEIRDPAPPLVAEATPGRWPSSEGRAYEDLSAAVRDANEAVQEGTEETAGAEPETRPGLASMEAFDASLYFLDPSEIEYLRQETEREYGVDLRRQVLCALLDIFELQADPLVRDEVAGDIEALTLHMLTAQEYLTVAFLLKELQGTLQRARQVRPQDRERLGKLADRLSHPDALSQMLQALEESATLPAREDLALLFAQLTPQALGPVLEHIDRTQNSELRPLMEAAAERLAQSNTAELVKLVMDAKPAVAREAIRRAGALQTASAVPSLGVVLASTAERPLRAAAVAALTDIGTPGALAALETALNDAEREIRLAAIRALTARAHRPALSKVQAIIQGKAAREIDRTERIAIFELYGTICGSGGVAVLDQILNAKGGFLARKEDPEVRACAAIGLGKVNADAARASLQKAAADKDVIVRNAVTRALRGGSPT